MTVMFNGTGLQQLNINSRL